MRWIYVPFDSGAVGEGTSNDGPSPAPDDASSGVADAAAKASEDESWSGYATAPEASGDGWRFELIRHAPVAELHRTGDLERRATIFALMDYIEPCTLYRPLVAAVDPGRVGIYFPVARTRVEGEFEALLSNVWVPDPDRPRFVRLSFDSGTFAAWYGGRAFSTDVGPGKRTSDVEVEQPKTETYSLAQGELKCTTGCMVSAPGLTATIRSAAVFSLAFSRPLSFREITERARALDRLFGFLVGHHDKPPVFTLVTNQTVDVDGSSLPIEGKLEVGSKQWMPGPAPQSLHCVHRRGWGSATLETILDRFFADQDGISTRMHAVDFSQHFSHNLYDRFSVVMPALEQYVKKHYATPDEVTYMHLEKAFFAWVETAPEPDFIEFSKKHTKTVKAKSPSLRTLLERAIKFANGKGFEIPEDTAEKLQARRGALFHSATSLTEADVTGFYREVQAATALLMIHTFEDLGIDASCLVHSGLRSPSLRNFIPLPPRSGALVSMTLQQYAATAAAAEQRDAAPPSTDPVAEPDASEVAPRSASSAATRPPPSASAAPPPPPELPSPSPP